MAHEHPPLLVPLTDGNATNIVWHHIRKQVIGKNVTQYDYAILKPSHNG